MKLLYHANCADGIFAAYLTSYKFPGCELIPMRYQEQVPNISDEDDLVCVDYCPEIEILKTIKPKSLLVIDHHKSANESLKDFVPEYPFSYIYDVDECGSTLAWKYFYPNSPIPWILSYIRDRDLWKWELPDSRKVSACIASYPFNFDSCRKLELMGQEQCAVEGAAIVRYQDKLIRQAVAQAREIEFHGYRVMSVNSSVLQSEIGHELSKGYPFAIIWFNQDKIKRFVYSLRSDENGVDVSEIAKAYGGGGHQHAASFSSPWHMEPDEARDADLST